MSAAAAVSVRRLWPPWRYVVIDRTLKASIYGPLVGVAITNGRKVWGREEAEAFAADHSRRFCDGTWERENYG